VIRSLTPESLFSAGQLILRTDIDKDHIVRQRTADSTSQEWSDGPINDLQLTAFDGDLVGLHACWVGKDRQAPLRLWYASDNATFQEYVRKRNGWTRERTWEGYSGAAGVGCYSMGVGDLIYVALINTSNELEIWYRDIANQQSEWEQSKKVFSSSLTAHGSRTRSRYRRRGRAPRLIHIAFQIYLRVADTRTRSFVGSGDALGGKHH